MAAPTDVLPRIDEIENELHGLSAELHEIRILVTQATIAPARPSRRRRLAVTPPATIRSPHEPAHPAARLEAAISAARIHLSEGERSAALDELERAIEFSRTDPQALRRLESILEGIARYQSSVRPRAGALAEAGALRRARGREARGTERGARHAAGAPAAPRLPIPPRAPPSPGHPGQAGQDAPHGRAARAGLGSARPAWLRDHRRRRHGVRRHPALRARREPRLDHAGDAGRVRRRRLGSSRWRRVLGAVTLRPAAVVARRGRRGHRRRLRDARRRAARYDLVPDALALPLAGGLAALAVVIAIAWSSETVAAIGLLGAALAPVLQAIDTGLSWASVAFAVIILAATVALAVPRRWHKLLIAIGVVVGAQVALLALDADASAGAGTIAVVASFVLVVLAAGSGCSSSPARRISILSRARSCSPPSAWRSCSCGRSGTSIATRATRSRRGPGLGRRLVRATPPAACPCARARCLVALARGRCDRRSAVGHEPCDHLGGRGAAALVPRAARSRCAPAGNRSRLLRDHRGPRASRRCPAEARVRGAGSGMAAASVAGLALALLGTALLAPAEAAARTETGLLAWLAPVRVWLSAHRVGLQEGLVLGSAAAGTYAVAILLTAYSFRTGHLAATIVAAAVGAAAVAISSRRGSVELVAASLAWVGGVFAIATGFDVPEFAVDAIHRSYGGWALIAASAGVLAACFAFQLLFRESARRASPRAAASSPLPGPRPASRSSRLQATCSSRPGSAGACSSRPSSLSAWPRACSAFRGTAIS